MTFPGELQEWTKCLSEDISERYIKAMALHLGQHWNQLGRLKTKYRLRSHSQRLWCENAHDMQPGVDIFASQGI